MKTIRLIVELTYNADQMHAGDKEAEDWFINEILKGDHLNLIDSGDIGDEIGQVRVIDLVDSDLGSTGGVTNPPKSATIEDKLKKWYDDLPQLYLPSDRDNSVIWEIQPSELASLITTETTKARIDEIYRFLDRSDTLSEIKYATRRINELRPDLQKEQNQ